MCVCRHTGLTDDRHPGVSTGERPEVHLSMPGKQMYSHTVSTRSSFVRNINTDYLNYFKTIF